jgi:hypothetical protein
MIYEIGEVLNHFIPTISRVVSHDECHCGPQKEGGSCRRHTETGIHVRECKRLMVRGRRKQLEWYQ